jgi:uncharacterized membrane protein YgdD (TMEM256/DUF423 family)
MNWSATAAFMMAMGVVLGAFGAHGLRSRLDAYSMGIYEKAVFYHFIHALGMLIVSFLPKLGALSESAASWVCGLFFVGILIFAGSLYVLAITRYPMLGAITPVGGASFIAAWLALSWFLMRK